MEIPKIRLLYIALLGVLGVLARYGLGTEIGRVFPSEFPYGTFAINLLGAFLIGLIFVLGVERVALSEDLRIGIMVGFLGGFTTFSSYCLEFSRLIEKGNYAFAFLYFGLSNFLGFAFCFLGMILARVF